MIKFAPGYKKAIESGEKKITIRNGIINNIFPGDIEETNVHSQVRITSVLYTTFEKIPREDMADDGFHSRPDMMRKLREFYSGLSVKDLCTVIRFEVE